MKKARKMIKIGINGFGRIGRAIFRITSMFDDIQVVMINDINRENENLKYLLKYDSFYGRFEKDLSADDKTIIMDGSSIRIFHEENISNVPWIDHGCDLVIESAGAHKLLNELPCLIESGVKKVIVTYAPDEINNAIVLGANEGAYDDESHHIISSSICDVVALAPVYKLIDDKFSVNNGFLTTLHPWLAYQNLLDGPPQSWGYPGELYGHYSLGRAATASLILKPTTAISAANKIIPGINDKMSCYSYRVPTPVVGAADITLQTKKVTNKKEVLDLFRQFIANQKWPILYLNDDPLVSIDFRGTDYSAIVDSRWFDVMNGNLIKITLWYDNEFGYSRRVVDITRHMFGLKPKMHTHAQNSLS